jgi:hypothetical protein
MLRKAVSRVVVAAALLLVLAVAAPTGLRAQDLTVPLTEEQVACDAGKLNALFNLAMRYSFGGKPWTFYASPSRGDSLGLLLIRNQVHGPLAGEPVIPEFEPEQHLAGTLTTTMRSLLLNPERPRIEQASLVRDDANSTHLDPERPATLILEIDPFFDPSGEVAGQLRINLFELEGTSRPGRALREEGVIRTCHDLLTDEDRLIFSVLQRIFRPRYEWLFPFDINSGESEVAIYRGTAPDTYRIDAYRVDGIFPIFVQDDDLTLLELVIERDAEGRLDTGELRLLTALDSFFLDRGLRELFFIPATFPGVEIWSEVDPRVQRFPFPEAFEDGPVTIDLAVLLEGSTWNPPRQ